MTGTEPRWLDQDEAAAWRGLLRVVQLLPQALDRQLREEAGISHAYYSILAVLSDVPNRTLTMGELARRSGASPSRLSHAVAALETRGWLTRAQCTTDRRQQYATLTPEGFAELERIAPGHVEEVRRRVFDRLTPAQVAQLAAIGAALGPGLEQREE